MFLLDQHQQFLWVVLICILLVNCIWVDRMINIPLFKRGSYRSTVKIGNAIAVNELVPDLQGKSVAQVVHAIEQGVQLAYATSQRPFSSIVLPQKNAYYCGQLLQWKMLEIIYMGALLEVNPFDQPQVELYKQETRKILAHE